MIRKIIEKRTITQASKILHLRQSHLQFGSSITCSPMFAALIITEIMSEAKDTKQRISNSKTFLDTSKAFDVVDHQGMLNALHSQCVRETMAALQ